MSITDTLSGSAIPFGAEPVPAGQGLFGMIDAVRQQETVTPGMAVAHRASTDATQYRDAFKFGNASARAEFWGVVATKGGSPTMDIAAFAGNGQGISVLFLGYAPVLVAPGMTVRRGMFLEPIPLGTGQAMFRPVVAGGRGVVQALADCDNSAGTAGAWVSGYVNAAGFGEGLVGSNTTASTVITNVAVRTAYNRTVTIPANTIKVGDRYRITAHGRSLNNAASTHLFELWLNGLTVPAGALLTSPAFAATELTSGSHFKLVCDVEIISATTMKGSGTITCQDTTSASGTLGAVGTLDRTVDQVVTVSVTPGGASANDQTQLEDICVEKLN